MESLIKAKIEYLKGVAIPEYDKRRIASEQKGGVFARALKKETERLKEEISTLESGREKENGFFAKRPLPIKEGIFKYLENDDFIVENLDKTFTPQEKCAIIINANSFSIEEREKDLLELIEEDNSLEDGIVSWLDYKKECIEYFKNFKTEGYVFCCLENSITQSPKVFDNFEDAYNSHLRSGDISITKLNPKFAGENFAVMTVDKNKICDVKFYGSWQRIGAPKEKNPPLNNAVVQLRNPYKPYEFLLVPFERGSVVVADLKNEKVKKEIVSEGNFGIYKVDIPSVRVELNTDTFEEELKFSLHERVSRLTDIKRVTEDLTVNQKEEVNEIIQRMKEI